MQINVNKRSPMSSYKAISSAPKYLVITSYTPFPFRAFTLLPLIFAPAVILSISVRIEAVFWHFVPLIIGLCESFFALLVSVVKCCKTK